MKNPKLEEKIRRLEYRLDRAVRGIPHKELPQEKELVDYMKNMLKEKKAIWLKDKGKWIFIKCEAPEGKTTWEWIDDEFGTNASK